MIRKRIIFDETGQQINVENINKKFGDKNTRFNAEKSTKYSVDEIYN